MLDKNSAQTTRQRIMDSAEDIVIEQGATHLTFDELARKTGFSKGGILYHYPSKNILLQSMIHRMVTAFNIRRQHFTHQAGSEGITSAKTYILAMFEQYEKKDRSSTAIMAAAANDPELLQVVREHYKRNFDEIRTTVKHAGLAAMLFLAMDGMWLLDSMRLCTLTVIERQGLKTLLLKLADA